MSGPIAVVPYDIFRPKDLVNYALTANLPFVNVMDKGAKGDGFTDDTGAFISAHTALPATGGKIIAPYGTFLWNPSAITISKPYVTLEGAGAGTIFKRGVDSAGALLMVTGTGFRACSFRMQDFSLTATNTAVGIYIANINDVKLFDLWLQTGFNLLFLDHGSNYSIYGCTIESSRSNGIVGNQGSDVAIVDNQFYFNGVGGGGVAAIQIAKDAGYAYRPYGWRIIANAFEQGRSGHFIRAIQSVGAVIAGNEFSFAGMLAPNTFDDIKLESAEDTTISGNSFPAEFDALNNKGFGEVGYVRASRWNINVDAACQGTVIGANTYNPGMSGTINNLAVDTIIELPLQGTAVWNMGSTADNAVASTTMTIAGAAVGDPVTVAYSSLGNFAALITAHVYAPNQVIINVLNKTGAPLDPASGTLNVSVFKK